MMHKLVYCHVLSESMLITKNHIVLKLSLRFFLSFSLSLSSLFLSLSRSFIDDAVRAHNRKTMM